MPKELLDTHPQVRPVTHTADLGNGMVAAMHVTDSKEAICPFLGLDDRCTIYHDRPFVCRAFGTEVAPQMTCSYQDRNGRLRDGKERRAIEREHVKNQYRSLKRLLQ